MQRQFSVQAERSYYKNPPKNWKMADSGLVDVTMYCTAGADWAKYLCDKRVLELGAGECTYIPHLLTKGKPVHCVASDIFEDRYAPARKVLTSEFRNLEFRTLRADNIEMPDNAFDTILAFGCYHHLPDLLGAFRQAYRVLDRGGVLIFRDPCAANPAIYCKYLLVRRSVNEWPLSIRKTKDALERAGFAVERVNRFWLRFPWLPGGFWSTNIGFVARAM